MKNRSLLNDIRNGWLPAGVAMMLLVASGPVQAAAITVDESADDDPSVDNGACSLREAVIAANSNAAVDGCTAGESAPVVDEIAFDPALDGSPIGLSIAGTAEDAAATGDLDITEDLDIAGNGDVDPAIAGGSADAATIVTGNSIDRVFQVHGATTVNLEGFAITGGEAPDRGGGLHAGVDAEVILRDMLITGNVAGPAGSSPRGGGIAVLGDLTLEHSAVVANAVTASGLDSASGGGILVGDEADGSLTMSAVAVVRNEVTSEDGGALGAGIDFSGTSLVAEDVLVADNVARATDGDAIGGGLLAWSVSAGVAELRRTAVHGNTVEAGGTNEAHGGGLDTHTIDLNLVNTTVSGNAAVSGTGIAGSGGLRVRSASLAINNATLTDNTAESGTAANGVHGGMDVRDADTVAISNSIVAGNADSSDSFPDCRGTLDSGGYNLIGDNTGCDFVATIGDLIGSGATPIDPMLESFADNGGGFRVGAESVPQGTNALASGSPAVDAGNPNPVMNDMPPACETADQRDGVRPADGDEDGAAVCDIGAFELGADLTGGVEPGGSGGSGSATAPLMLGLLASLGLIRLTTMVGRKR